MPPYHNNKLTMVGLDSDCDEAYTPSKTIKASKRKRSAKPKMRDTQNIPPNGDVNYDNGQAKDVNKVDSPMAGVPALAQYTPPSTTDGNTDGLSHMVDIGGGCALVGSGLHYYNGGGSSNLSSDYTLPPSPYNAYNDGGNIYGAPNMNSANDRHGQTIHLPIEPDWFNVDPYEATDPSLDHYAQALDTEEDFDRTVFYTDIDNGGSATSGNMLTQTMHGMAGDEYQMTARGDGAEDNTQVKSENDAEDIVSSTPLSEREDDENDYDEWHPSKVPKLNKDGIPRKPRQPRPKLLKWDDNDWKNVALGLVWACGENGLQIPFDQASQVVSESCTAGALQQALLKLRGRQISEGFQIPLLKMAWTRKNKNATSSTSSANLSKPQHDNGTIKTSLPKKKPTRFVGNQSYIVTLKRAYKDTDRHHLGSPFRPARSTNSRSINAPVPSALAGSNHQRPPPHQSPAPVFGGNQTPARSSLGPFPLTLGQPAHRRASPSMVAGGYGLTYASSRPGYKGHPNRLYTINEYDDDFVGDVPDAPSKPKGMKVYGGKNEVAPHCNLPSFTFGQKREDDDGPGGGFGGGYGGGFNDGTLFT